MANRQPIFILSEDTQREKGKEAQESNFRAAKVIGETVRSTLGPKGMDKMLVDSMGDVTITNDGAAILDDMDIEHPAAKMIVEVAETQEEEVGDGTTTAVILAAELIEEASELLDQGIHPTVIASGYSKAAAKAQEFLEGMTKEVSFDDDEMLKKVATTAMTGKRVEANIGVLADLAVKAVKQVAEKTDDGYEVDLDNVGIEKQEGGSVDDSIIVDGIILSKDRVHPGMPKKIEEAKIALLNAAMEVKETETDSEIRVSSPEELQKFMEREEADLREMVDKIKEAGANVVICQKGIDDMVQHFLAKEGIFAIRRAKKSDMEKLARATGGKIVTDIDDISSEDLGGAGLVEERKISGEDMTFVEKCKHPTSISILVRGGTEHIVDEADRSLEDAMCVVARTVESGKILPGGGATEIELSMKVSDYADSIGGKEALAVKAFANAVESVVRALAKNAGLDPIDTIVELRNKHESGGASLGLDAYDGEVKDMIEEGVIEPLQIKTQAASSGSEAAVMILRIDDVIASKGESGGEPGGMPGGAPGGMPGGPGGMPPGMM
ncbi:thermosome subunit [candidate division MSBL1 archaeon SCGC-AAA259I09]|uniref:Thermosome subunit n=3 Tax=candidate division MSBL1 TaxID=215777 RepID=A0A133UTT5_9EURY|nr:thermosome subunit [candidate division MSBL1 archaeon SCGC-AAA259D14]KXA97632.1 thermosome subunit [candidate division MSBL1 archaeon SCGC-AAA259I09]KXB00661.1 thermosome subunit [candidate division MSBL1 archaeon SCGC-AAA259M10]